MNKISKTIAAGSLAMLTLAGCSSANSLATLLASDAGKAFIAALGVGGSLIPGIQAVLTNIDNGIVVNGAPALATVCYALPWAEGAVDAFGPAAKLSTAVISEIDSSVKTFIAGPCTTPPTDLSSAITEGAALFLAIEKDLQNGGVPVAVPTSAKVVPTMLRHH